MNIHPTAIVDPAAKIHESTEIGPYTIIDGKVEIGAGNKIHSSVRIYDHTKIGDHNTFYHGAVIGCDPQDLGFDRTIPSGTRIGNHNIFREYSNIHRGTKEDHHTVIGDHNFFMGNFHVGHDCILGDHNIFTHGTVLAGHVTVGNYAFISGVAAVHQFCRVGDFSMIAGCSKIVKDVPPYATADGNPATLAGLNTVGLKRSGMAPETRNALKAVYKTIFHSGKNISQAIKEVKTEQHGEEVQKVIHFFESSSRGVTDHR